MSYADVSVAPEDEGPPPPAKSDLYSYQFDTWYTTDPNAQVVVLILCNILCVIMLGLLFAITGSMGSMEGFEYATELAWLAWGQLSGTGGSPNGGLWGTRFAGVVTAFAGMFVFSLVCAFIEEAINAKLEALRKGKSKVLDTGFSLIIGWSDRLLPLIIQLTQANSSSGGGIIVVLAEKDKEWMDGYIQDNVPDMLGSSVITRAGQPIDLFSLRKVNAKEAKSIIVLSTIMDPDESDAQTTRIVLALTGSDKNNREKKEKFLGVPGDDGIKGHVVCELCNADNVEMVRLGIRQMERAKAFVKPVVPNDLTGRLMIQCCLEPGLAQVYAQILAFDFCEFYFKAWEGDEEAPYNYSLVDKRFADVCFCFENAVPLGVHLAKPQMTDSKTGSLSRILVNPPGDLVIQPGDEIIVIAEDDDSYWPGQGQFSDPGDVPAIDEAPDSAVNLMLIGFRSDLDDLIAEVDKWVQPGSALMLFCDKPVPARMKILEDGGLDVAKLENIKLYHFVGSPMLLPNLEEVRPQDYNGIIVITEKRDGVDGLYCDSRTMVTTLLIRDIQKREEAQGVLVSEILDPRTQGLLKLPQLNDFICSNDFVAMALGQMSEESDIFGLIEDLFSPDGSEMHIKDIKLYAREGEALNFWELAVRARLRLEVCLGWIKADEYKGGAGVPCLNPTDKNEAHVWHYGDQLVVLSED